jgi:DNA-binding NarL/FixJ family response regulator
MPTIAVIDDRQPARETLRDLLSIYTESLNEWGVIEVPPLPDLREYPGWIDEHDVAVVLTDERLHEGAESDAGEAVAYNGHNLVDFLRPRYPSLPIYVITAYPNEESLTSRFGSVEDVIIKGELTDKSAEYVERFIRAGSKFFEEHQAELQRLGELSRKTAVGDAAADEIEELRGLQERLGIPYDAATPTRSEWIGTFEEAIGELEQIEARLNELRQTK